MCNDSFAHKPKQQTQPVKRRVRKERQSKNGTKTSSNFQEISISFRFLPAKSEQVSLSPDPDLHTVNSHRALTHRMPQNDAMQWQPAREANAAIVLFIEMVRACIFIFKSLLLLFMAQQDHFNYNVSDVFISRPFTVAVHDARVQTQCAIPHFLPSSHCLSVSLFSFGQMTGPHVNCEWMRRQHMVSFGCLFRNS